MLNYSRAGRQIPSSANPVDPIKLTRNVKKGMASQAMKPRIPVPIVQDNQTIQCALVFEVRCREFRRMQTKTFPGMWTQMVPPAISPNRSEVSNEVRRYPQGKEPGRVWITRNRHSIGNNFYGKSSTSKSSTCNPFPRVRIESNTKQDMSRLSMSCMHIMP